MLKITPAQLAIITREHLLQRLHTVMLERSPDPQVQALLASPEACRDFWAPHYDAFGSIDEHAMAVRLAYLLAARAHAMDPRLAQVAGDDGVLAMKLRLEERGILPFAAFDG